MTGIPTPFSGLLPLEKHITYAAILLAAAQCLFVVNVVWSAWRGRPSPPNPWRATTLEWMIGQPEQVVSVCRGPYEYGLHDGKEDFRMQWEPEGKEE